MKVKQLFEKLGISEKKACPSCGSMDLVNFTYTENGEEFPAKKCKCGWWGSDI